jgi:1-acyl-sn-glycerol-3-phosphate acyltransferase
MLQKMSKFILKSIGWEIECKLPVDKKYLIIGAFHTSNWDLPLTLLMLSAMKLKFNWVGKHTLFYWPFGYFFKAIGGIPVNRGINSGFIQKVSDLYNNTDKLVIAMSPEGTRSKTEYWKTGFYYIALKAKIPVALAYVDYPDKQIGIGKYFTPTGDINEDLEIIKDFYKSKRGKFTEKQSDIKIRAKN